MTLWSAAIMLFLVMDPLGNIPIFITVLSDVDAKRRKRILIRELLIALFIMLCFLFFGNHILQAMSISGPALSIAGGIILFIIAIRMIFPIRQRALMGDNPDSEPFIVPLAIPLVAGPSTIATIMLMSSNEPKRILDWLVVILAVWLVSAVILLFSDFLSKLFHKRGLAAMERLMGMILTTIAVEMFLKGLATFFRISG
ncbi:MAG: YhgN family NAAT transporter [Candidatus Marinimicrobia bacterium]|nr:YhgN family NAAT transporter [Candidatus Neomarinimicrobiota bacterium]